MRNIPVKIRRLHPDAVIPQYATAGAAGFDLVAVEDVLIQPWESRLIPLGFCIELPKGYELQIRPRSGISLKTRLRIGNAPGTVDSDFRGEIGVIVDNISQFADVQFHLAKTIDLRRVSVPYLIDANTYIIRKGDRIAQAVIAEVPRAVFTEVDSLDDTERGAGGFGSTGVGTYDDAELYNMMPEVSN